MTRMPCGYCRRGEDNPCASLKEAEGCMHYHPPGPRHAIVTPSPNVIFQKLAGQSGDPVHQPPHYARWKMQPIEFLMINDVPGWLFNVVKYCFRYDAKDGLQDLYKARSYLDMKIRQLEGAERFWEKPVAEERRLNKHVE